jgi:hypothetical protein
MKRLLIAAVVAGSLVACSSDPEPVAQTDYCPMFDKGLDVAWIIRTALYESTGILITEAKAEAMAAEREADCS